MTILKFNKNESDFFVAICKSDVHSFLAFGVYNKVKKENYLLARFGKQIDLVNAKESLVSECSKMLFSSTGAQLVSELVIKSDENDRYQQAKEKISYKAFEVDIEHYRSFLAMLQKSNQFTRLSGLCAYQLAEEDATTLTFNFKKIADINKNPHISLKADIDSHSHASNISIANTCRHTVLLWLEMVFGGRFFDTDIITNYSGFYKNFPYQTNIINIYSVVGNKRNLISAEMDDNFLIFPMPPKPYVKDDLPGLILHKLYNQLNTVSKKYLDNDVTYKKFDAIKSLYKTVDSLKGQPHQAVFNAIDQWVLTNAVLIDQKRGVSFFSTTGTRAMIHSFQRMKSRQLDTMPNAVVVLSS